MHEISALPFYELQLVLPRKPPHSQISDMWWCFCLRNKCLTLPFLSINYNSRIHFLYTQPESFPFSLQNFVHHLH